MTLGTRLGSWTRHLNLTVPLSTQEYKWVLAVGVGLAPHPGGVLSNTPSQLHATKTGVNSGIAGPNLAPNGFTFLGLNSVPKLKHDLL